MAPHSSTLAWKIPWTEEPGKLQSMGMQRVGQDWVTSLSLFAFMHWRRKWEPIPVFLTGGSLGWQSLVGYRLWGRTESETTEATWQQQHVWMGELGHKEAWALKNWCIWTVVLEKTLESPLDSNEIKPVNPKGNSPEYSLEGLILKKLRYFGHLMQRADSLEKNLILRKIEGKRRRGWQRMRWFDSITNSMDLNLIKLLETVEDRRAWRAAVHRVTKSQTRLSNWTTTNRNFLHAICQ